MGERRVFQDLRELEGRCAYCGCNFSDGVSASGRDSRKTRDHVPSKVFLDTPYPPDMMTVPVCFDCNNHLSQPELYLALLLEARECGSLDTNLWTRQRLARRAERSPTLMSRLRNVEVKDEIDWHSVPEALIVGLKHALGHLYYEEGLHIWGPLTLFSDPLRPELPLWETVSKLRHLPWIVISYSPEITPGWGSPLLPEVGTRALFRLIESFDEIESFDDWRPVQSDSYRFRIVHSGSKLITQVQIRQHFTFSLSADRVDL